MDWGMTALGLGLAAALAAISLIDIRTQRIPDRLSLPLLGAGLLVAALRPEAGFADYAIGAALGYASLAVFGGFYFRLTGVDGLGLGDAKLFAAAGAWAGWAALPQILLIASVAGLAFAVTRRLMGRPLDGVPFAPFLSLALLIVWAAASRAS